jgi:hypothetical protein
MSLLRMRIQICAMIAAGTDLLSRRRRNFRASLTGGGCLSFALLPACMF